MSAFDILSKILTYPQSVATGIAGYGGGGTLTGMMGRATGDEEVLKAGLRGNLSPSQLGAYNSVGSEYNVNNPVADIFAKIGGTGADLAYDPMLAVGESGILSKVAEGTKLEPLVKGAGTFGKMEDATKLEKAGQLGRRYYQGLLATSDPLAAIGVAAGIGGAERTLPAITRLLGKTGAKTVEEAVDEVLKGPADTVAKNLDGAYAKTGDELLQEVIAKRSDYEPNFVRIAGELPAGPPPPDYRQFVPKELNAGPAAGVGKSAIPMEPIKPDEILMLNKGESPLALPRGARVQGPPEGAVPLDEALQSILGTRQANAYAAGDRPDAILRALLESNRSGKGKFLNAEQKRVLQNFIDNPDALGQLMRMYAG